MADIILMVILGVGFVSGLFSGAVRQVVSFAAFVVGFVVACLYYPQLAEAMESVIPVPAFCQVAAFVVLWVAVPVVAKLVASLLTSALNKLPVMGLLNRLLGGIFCMAKYALVLGAFLWLFSSMHLLTDETLRESKLCSPLKALPEYLYHTLHPSQPCGRQ